MSVLSECEVEILRLVAIHPYYHFDLPHPQRLRMGHLWSEGYVRLSEPNTWEITETGETVLAAHRTLN
ncbi:MAG: hypothetical protein ACRCS9_09735 [Hyphomicrobium sp.]